MTGGSYIRFAIGIVLSLTVLASFLAREPVNGFSALLALAFVALAALWTLFRF